MSLPAHSVLKLVSMVLEWDDVLVPAWQVAIDLHGHKLGQPGNVLNFLLLQFEESVETAEVEAVFKGLRESSGCLFEHDLVCRNKC